MKKIFCLCLTCLFAYVSTAQARVEFITKDSAITFKSPNSAGCKSGETNYGGRCIPTCSKSIYPFEKAPDAKKGVVEPCSGIKTRYRYTECNTGYEWNTNKTDCILADCSGYPVTKDGLDKDAGSYEPCQSGDTTTYRYTNCNRGWNKQGNLCVANICSSGYPNDYDAIKPDDKVGHYDFCYSRKKTFWGYTDCLGEDKELYQGACYNKCTGFNSMVDAIEGCKVSKSCVSKDGTRFKCTECDESKGYDKEPVDGKCKEAVKVTACPKGQENTYWYQHPNMGSYDNQKVGTGCTEGDYCWRTDATSSMYDNGYYGRCTKCQKGYSLKNNACVPDSGVGSIYEYNGKPIGVVFYEDDEIVKIVALENIGKYPWMDKEAIDGGAGDGSNGDGFIHTTNFENIVKLLDNKKCIEDVDGDFNTDVILAFNANYQAAKVAREYAPAVCNADSPCGKGSWYLPSIDELVLADKIWTFDSDCSNCASPLRHALRAVNNNVVLYNSISGYLWSSTESDSKIACSMNMGYNNLSGGADLKDTVNYVRPVLKISKKPIAVGRGRTPVTPTEKKGCSWSQWPKCGTANSSTVEITEELQKSGCYVCVIEGIPAITARDEVQKKTASGANTRCKKGWEEENGTDFSDIEVQIYYYYWWPQLGETEKDKKAMDLFKSGWEKCNRSNADHDECVKKGIEECEKDVNEYYPIGKTKLPPSSTSSSDWGKHYWMSNHTFRY